MYNSNINCTEKSLFLLSLYDVGFNLLYYDIDIWSCQEISIRNYVIKYVKSSQA